MKTLTLDELQDKLNSEKGTTKRNVFEKELQMDLMRNATNQIQKELKPNDIFLSTLSAPARRALENNGITTLEQLSKYSKKDILKFHGMGKSSIPKLEKLLSEQNMTFRLSE
jgi:DNA-directed RNA polymerase alpha subunit